jgi:hypothetical protein
VSEDVPLLETESGAQSTTLSEHEMQSLPNFARWEYFIILMPGSAGTPTGGNSNVAPGQTASVNGNAVFYNVLGDGMTMSLPANGNAYDYNFDTLAEVQIVSIDLLRHKVTAEVKNMLALDQGEYVRGVEHQLMAELHWFPSIYRRDPEQYQRSQLCGLPARTTTELGCNRLAGVLSTI